MEAAQRHRLPLFTDSPWQMAYGERAALEGLVSQLRPQLAIEVGTAEGGSLASLAPHCGELHSFDLVAPQISLEPFDNLVLHTGDSHELLGPALEEFAAQGRNVDFALVDGDHTAAGVKSDVEALLDSPAVGRSVICIHDTNNGVVREGVESIDWDRYPKIEYLDLDFVAGYVFRKPPYAGELWGGIGLILTEERASVRPDHTGPRQDARYPAFELIADGWRTYAERERKLATLTGLAGPFSRDVPGLERALEQVHDRLRACETELARSRAEEAAMRTSLSWRITQPLRALKRRATAGRRR